MITFQKFPATTSHRVRKSRWLALCLVMASMFLSDAISASTPRLNIILPRGGQRGTELTLRFAGERIGDSQQVLLYDTGIEILGISKVDDNQVDVKVQIAADCRLGEHVLQLRTPRGFSDYRSFYVGQWSAVDEVEPNQSIDAAQAIEMNRTVHGTVTNEDVDYFAVAAKAGQRISVEIEAIRLGAMFDPFVAIVNAERFELAVCDDTPLFKQDAFVSILAPADGTYYVLVRESAYGGNESCRYRLHVGDFARPTAVYPAGGAPGSTVELKFLGDPSGPLARQVQLPAAFGFREGLFCEDGSTLSPSALPFRLNDLPNHLEIEPNDTWTTEPILSLPAAINGVVQIPGDVDFYLFQASKGQVWEFECFAKRLGSGLDPVMNIYKASDKSHLVGNDDSRGSDPYIRWTAPEDGQYYVRITDHLSRGREDFVYRLEVFAAQAGLAISIPRVDRYSQLQQTIPIPAGNRFATLINASRENFGGSLELLVDQLPPGIRLVAQPMPAGLSSMPVVFEADANLEPAGQLIDFRARWAEENQTLTGGFQNLSDFALGEPNNALYYGCTVDRLAIGITKPAPYRIDLIQPTAPLAKDGALDLKVVVSRDAGYQGPINLQFPFRSPGVGTTYQITLPAEQNEIVYTINAAGNAQVGKWPMYVIGNGAVEGGPLWVSSTLCELEVVDPFVKIDAKRSACEQGQVGKVLCQLEHVTSFEGTATVELLGLPPNVTAEPRSFTKETTEVIFDLATNDQSPLGNHKSLFCQVKIPYQGGEIRYVTGRTEFQISKPTPVVVAAPPPAAAPAATAEPAPPPAPPPAVPLTRLQQLRQKAQQAKQGETSGGNQ